MAHTCHPKFNTKGSYAEQDLDNDLAQAVVADCAHVRAGVWGGANQNVIDPSLGPLMLDQLRAGLSASATLEASFQDCPYVNYRLQLAACVQRVTKPTQASSYGVPFNE